MSKIKRFFKAALLGGVMVILPVVLTFFFLRWFVNLVTGLIDPLSRFMVYKTHIHRTAADLLRKELNNSWEFQSQAFQETLILWLRKAF